MSMKKTQDLAVKTGTYMKDGQEKGRYENVGHILTNDEDGSKMILLKRTFNPAGVINPDNRDTIILNRFDVNDGGQAQAPRQQPQQQPQQQAPQQQAPQQQAPGPAPAGGFDSFDDDIPF